MISFIPFLLLFILLKCRRGSAARSGALLSDSVLRVFVCFAVGGLLGDAFLHLIPHAINPHTHTDGASTPSPIIQYLISVLPFAQSSPAPSSPASPFHLPPAPSSHAHSHGHGHDHSHAHAHEEVGSDSRGQRAGLLVLAGMLLFFLIEKTARLRMGDGEDGDHSHSHGHSHGHGHADTATALAKADESHSDTVAAEAVDGVVGPAATVLRRRRPRNGVDRSAHSPSPSQSPPPRPMGAPSSRGPQPQPSASSSSPSSSGSLVGVLNLIADLSHNFTDGLAISASFLSSPAVGLSTTLAVLIHEVPHEIGDFAILLQAGYSLQQALWFQLVTAVGALLGVAVVWLGGSGDGQGGMDWVLPVTAGGFIYVGLVNVVPGVLKNEKDGPKGSARLVQVACEVAAMCLGVGLMVLIGLLE